MKTPRQILIAARKLIERPECWTQNAPARTQSGAVAKVFGQSAVCFCSWGAVVKIDGDSSFLSDEARVAIDLLTRAARDKGVAGAIRFNDTHTHPEVLAMFDTAIAAAAEGASNGQ